MAYGCIDAKPSSKPVGLPHTGATAPSLAPAKIRKGCDGATGRSKKSLTRAPYIPRQTTIPLRLLALLDKPVARPRGEPAARRGSDAELLPLAQPEVRPPPALTHIQPAWAKPGPTFHREDPPFRHLAANGSSRRDGRQAGSIHDLSLPVLPPTTPSL